ncbi:MAG TPA: NADH-quinone oxidoreductase subunit L [Anaerolineae bacterium]|nr:NADH-quinone oxidoreductase subunit L [Anaerolineae bacterium]
MNPFGFVPLILAFPILGLLTNLVFGRKLGEKWIGIFACGAAALSFGVAVGTLATLLNIPEGGEVMLWERLRIGVFEIPIALKVDALATTMMLVVTGVGTLIHIYAVGYMHGDPRFARFFIYLNLFLVAMLVLVLADNYLLLFVGWELVGLCSYLLIGFWFEDLKNADAACKAFIVNRVGDFAFILGVILIFVTFGSLRYDEVFSQAGELFRAGAPVVTLVTLLLFIGATGKSAQIPLFVWLPDAMAGPTPVSALIHAATMVTAGVYMIARSEALYNLAPFTQSLVAAIGAVTALFAATIAVAQWDMKKVMAYSTISQLGYMIAAAGLGGYVAGIFHLITHAFFKALLFLSAGSVMHGCGNEGDMRNLGGLRRAMPTTFKVFVIGGFGLAGVPIFAGFWSKDAILGGAFEAFRETGTASWGLYVWLLLSASALLTALYVGRQMFLTFGGAPRTPAAEHARETGWAIGLPLLVLAGFAALAGFVGVPEEFPLLGPLLGDNWLLRFVGEQYGEAPLNFGVMGFSVALALAGWGLAWLLYGRRPLAAGQPDPLVAALGPIHTLLKNKYYGDELYAKVIVRPVVATATWVYTALDRAAIDGLLHGIGRTALRLAEATRAFDRIVVNGGVDSMTERMKRFSREFRMIQTGRLQDYLILMLASAAVFGIVLYLFTR